VSFAVAEADFNEYHSLMAQTSGVYEHGKVVLDQPVNWPEGSLVNVICENTKPGNPDRRIDGLAWEDSPQSIQEWIKWFDAGQPVLTSDDVEHFEADLSSNRERDKVLFPAWEHRINKLNK
jgi:hypothetical protein